MRRGFASHEAEVPGHQAYSAGLEADRGTHALVEGAKCRTARTTKEREMPNGARCRTARDPIRRGIPNGARLRETAEPPAVSLPPRAAGLSRRPASGAVRHFALFGIP